MTDSAHILTTYSQVRPFLDTIRGQADKNRSALGFLPASAYDELASQGKLWVSVLPEDNRCLGHLMFGGVMPSLRVFQLLVYDSNRGAGVGRNLIDRLVHYGEERSYLTIIARVASDLKANTFWEKSGFHVIRQAPGGKTSGRTINIRVRELETPTLLRQMYSPKSKPATSMDGIQYLRRPLGNNPVYVLDLNVFFDVVRCRPHSEEASALLTAGFNSQIRVRVTAEFVSELERNSHGQGRDPVLELAKTLPELSPVPEKEIQHLKLALARIVFPAKSSSNLSIQDKSDLTHLASAIHHHASGFVTREKAILARRDILHEKYGLEVLSPNDFSSPFGDTNSTHDSLAVVVDDGQLDIASGDESDRHAVDRFLAGLGLSKSELAEVWNAGASGALRRRRCIRSSGGLIGVASWDMPSRYGTDGRLFLYVNEAVKAADTAVDHIFECAFRDAQSCGMRRMLLSSTSEQALTRSKALERGFISAKADAGVAVGDLMKICHGGVLFREDWSTFAGKYHELTGLTIPATMPTHAEFLHTGVRIRSPDGRQETLLRLFDFETLVSPSVVLCSGRDAVILPIRMSFAHELISGLDPQKQLFPGKEALLHVEKAYFRSRSKAALFRVGWPVVLYVSGASGGDKEAIGLGRITYSDVLLLSEVDSQLSRQSVLPRSDLEAIAKKSGKLHAFTFDNFIRFPNTIPFRTLREQGLVTAANLVTAEKLSAKHFELLCTLAYKGHP